MSSTGDDLDALIADSRMRKAAELLAAFPHNDRLEFQTFDAIDKARNAVDAWISKIPVREGNARPLGEVLRELVSLTIEDIALDNLDTALNHLIATSDCKRLNDSIIVANALAGLSNTYIAESDLAHYRNSASQELFAVLNGSDNAKALIDQHIVDSLNFLSPYLRGWVIIQVCPARSNFMPLSLRKAVLPMTL